MRFTIFLLLAYSCAATNDAFETEWNNWLPTFKAADPSSQDVCMNILVNRTGSPSQFEQVFEQVMANTAQSVEVEKLLCLLPGLVCFLQSVPALASARKEGVLRGQVCYSCNGSNHTAMVQITTPLQRRKRCQAAVKHLVF